MENQHAPAPDGRVRAAENEVRVLRALHRFGWLTAKNCAALLWGRPWAKTPAPAPSLELVAVRAAGLRMAQRTLARLVRSRQILRAPAPGGHVIYALAEAGVRRLVEIGAPASTGKDLIRRFSAAQFLHRHTANVVAIRALVDGFKVSTEREIAQQDRWLGGADGIHGKKPDVLIRAGQSVWWVEVENARRRATDYAKLLKWLGKVRADARLPNGPGLLGAGLRLAKVLLVCKPVMQTKLVKDLAAQSWKPTEIESLIVVDTKLLYRHEDAFFA